MVFIADTDPQEGNYVLPVFFRLLLSHYLSLDKIVCFDASTWTAVCVKTLNVGVCPSAGTVRRLLSQRGCRESFWDIYPVDAGGSCWEILKNYTLGHLKQTFLWLGCHQPIHFLHRSSALWFMIFKSEGLSLSAWYCFLLIQVKFLCCSISPSKTHQPLINYVKLIREQSPLLCLCPFVLWDFFHDFSVKSHSPGWNIFLQICCTLNSWANWTSTVITVKW